MGKEEVPVCHRHPDEVRMTLRTLHSDMGRPGQVLAVYACPECGYERRLPIRLRTREGGVPGQAEGSVAWGAA
jgi:hypothetical protein